MSSGGVLSIPRRSAVEEKLSSSSVKCSVRFTAPPLPGSVHVQVERDCSYCPGQQDNQCQVFPTRFRCAPPSLSAREASSRSHAVFPDDWDGGRRTQEANRDSKRPFWPTENFLAQRASLSIAIDRISPRHKRVRDPIHRGKIPDRIGRLNNYVGGGGRNRTGVHGFAGRCMTTLPPRRVLETRNSEGYRNGLFLGILERETSLELATLTLARLRSTN